MPLPRALVVDDDDGIRHLLATVVSHQGFSVDTARDGAEAIERLDADTYGVILLDLMMPRVDGYAVLRHLNDRQPQLLSRTIVATAVPERDIPPSSVRGVCHVHTKPFDIPRLIADIRRCGTGPRS